MRAAARNAAGFSEWTRVEKLKTLALPLTYEDTSQTSAASTSTFIFSIEFFRQSFIIPQSFVLLFTIMINYIDYRLFNKNYLQN